MIWAPVPAWAASLAVSINDPLMNINFPVLALAFSLATLSGATALIWRLDKELRSSPDGKLPRPWLFAASNIMGSWTAGALAWITSQGQEFSVWQTLAMVILFSFGGARLIELLVEKYISNASPDKWAARQDEKRPLD